MSVSARTLETFICRLRIIDRSLDTATRRSLYSIMADYIIFRPAVQKAIEEANKQIAALAPKLKEKPHITHKILTDDEIRKSLTKQQGFLSKLIHKLGS